LKGTLWAVDLELPHSLNRSDEASFEYVTSFRYDGHVDPVFRRVAHQRIENAAFRVAFHPHRLPKRVWWAEWADYREPDDRIIEQVEVTLDDEHAVHHQVDVLERAVAGLTWEF
jgi:hypothetical protein